MAVGLLSSSIVSWGEAPVEAVVTKSRAGFNFSVITCREVAKLGGISKGHEWRGWVKSWVMVS